MVIQRVWNTFLMKIMPTQMHTRQKSVLLIVFPKYLLISLSQLSPSSI